MAAPLAFLARQVSRRVTNKLSEFFKKLPQESRKGQRRRADSPSADPTISFKPGRVMDRRLRSTKKSSVASSKRMKTASKLSGAKEKKTFTSILDSMIKKRKR